MTSSKSKRQTLEQQRAKSAWEAIKQVSDETAQKKYGTLARKLSSMIQTNGLGTTFAFLQAKGQKKDTDAHTMIYNHVSAWVLRQLEVDKTYRNGMMDFVRDAETGSYRRATAEAIEYGIWLKRYVEAEGWGSAEGDD